MTVLDWLLDSDPSIRWQALRDLADAPADVVAQERARVASEGWGARLLALQGDDGQWAGGACFPGGWSFEQPGREGQPWTSTLPTLQLLHDFGVDPSSDRVRRAVAMVRDHSRWEHAGQPFFSGEVEPCINGRVVTLGTYFGLDVDGVVERLLGEQLEDGGWNCDTERGSVRSSFATTINVLEGLLAHERATGGSAASIAARRRGEEYLLERKLFRRKTSHGGPVALHLLECRATHEQRACRAKELQVVLVEGLIEREGHDVLSGTLVEAVERHHVADDDLAHASVSVSSTSSARGARAERETDMLKLNNLMIGTSDVKAMAGFYEKVFGRPADLIEGDQWFSWNTSDKMSFSIGPHSEVTGRAKEPQRMILNMETPEVQKEFARIKKAAGATVVKEPYEMGGAWIATVADPDGNYFQLISSIEPQKPA